MLEVPVIYPPANLVAASVLANGLLQIEEDFESAWERAAPRMRAVGVPILALAKPRPVLVLRVGAAEDDWWHREDVWVLPRYTRKEYGSERSGANIFDLPAAAELGLDEDGFLDFFQVTMLPVSYLKLQQHRCDLSPAAFDALIAAFRAFLVS